MKTTYLNFTSVLILLNCLLTPFLNAQDLPYDSGSNGADGPLELTESGTITIDMNEKPDGVWNYTSIYIGPEVTVTFIKNEANTPVVWLATEDVVIEGTVDVSGQFGIGVQKTPSGPGGFDGGEGGIIFKESGLYMGQPGKGPGGGIPGLERATAGGDGNSTYMNEFLQPLIGGSGGGGGASADDDSNSYGYTSIGDGQPGRGGGGAILIGSSQDITLNGTILAEGSNFYVGAQGSGTAGRGSGGAVRFVADRVLGSGNISVAGGFNPAVVSNPATLNPGRIRIEGFVRSLVSSIIINRPEEVFPPGTDIETPLLEDILFESLPLPTLNFPLKYSDYQLAITEVAGEAVSQPATSSFVIPDVLFFEDRPVDIKVEAVRNIPNGSKVSLTLYAEGGTPITLPAEGQPDVTLTNGQATFNITIPAGYGVIQAQADVVIS